MLYARSPIFSQVPRWPIHPFTRCDGLLLPSEYEIVLLPALSRYSKTTQYFRAMAIPSTEKPSCRTDQFQLLSQYIPGPGYPLPEALVAQGLQGTGVIKHLIGSFFWLKMSKCLGKTATLQHHLASVNIPHAFIHCVEVYQPRLLFQVGGSSQEIAS